jgi:hypothetical protein
MESGGKSDAERDTEFRIERKGVGGWWLPVHLVGPEDCRTPDDKWKEGRRAVVLG